MVIDSPKVVYPLLFSQRFKIINIKVFTSLDAALNWIH